MIQWFIDNPIPFLIIWAILSIGGAYAWEYIEDRWLW